MLTDTDLAGMRELAAESYTATITVRDDEGGGWDPGTGPGTPGDGPPLYGPDKPARVQAVRNSAQPREAAGQAVTVRPYKIALPHDAPDLPVGARVTVTAHPTDPHVVGKALTVTGTAYGDLGIERVLYADLDLSNQ
ncbi:DUF6093 family protein [Pseudactinotalea sp. Z1732]|uniref:DUF6093 family protein n=1 Tax=Micrococcales TaxID=85006 RepID=UPI003C7B20D6